MMDASKIREITAAIFGGILDAANKKTNENKFTAPVPMFVPPIPPVETNPNWTSADPFATDRPIQMPSSVPASVLEAIACSVYDGYDRRMIEIEHCDNNVDVVVGCATLNGISPMDMNIVHIIYSNKIVTFIKQTCNPFDEDENTVYWCIDTDYAVTTDRISQDYYFNKRKVNGSYSKIPPTIMIIATSVANILSGKFDYYRCRNEKEVERIAGIIADSPYRNRFNFYRTSVANPKDTWLEKAVPDNFVLPAPKPVCDVVNNITPTVSVPIPRKDKNITPIKRGDKNKPSDPVVE